MFILITDLVYGANKEQGKLPKSKVNIGGRGLVGGWGGEEP